MSEEERADLFHKVLGERRNEDWIESSFDNVRFSRNPIEAAGEQSTGLTRW